jgi:DNA-binding CsgD family transcriptional regulator
MVVDVLAGRAPRPVLVVAGEAGIGKSRLVTSAAGLVRAEGVSVLTASCLPLTEAAPLLPIADILRTAFGVDGGAWLNTALERCPAYVLATLAPLVPELSSSSSSSSAREDGDGLWRQRLFSAVRLLLAQLAELRPLALVLEDVHWSDSSTLDLLDHLLHAGDGPPTTLVLTWRSDADSISAATSGWFARAVRSTRTALIELPRLSQAETVEQVALATGSVDPALAAALFVRSEGNPLFTEQLLGANGTLPADLRAVFDAKLTGLSPAQLATLTALAVVRRPLPADLLGQLLDEGVDLAATLRELRALRLLRPDGTLVALRHALLGDAILADVPAERLAPLSARVASAMASWGPHGSTSEIAEHWQRAGDARNELTWRIKAATAAYAAHANVEAVHHWLRLIAVWDEVPDAEEIAGMPLYEVYLTADWAFFDAGMTERSIELMDSAVLRFRDAPPVVLASLLRRQGRNRSWSNPHEAVELIDRSHALFASQEPNAEWVYGLSDLADSRRASGRYEDAIDAANRGLEVAAACGATSLVRRMYAHRALSEAALGDLAAVSRTLAELARAPEPDTLRERTVVATRYSDLLLAMGSYADVPPIVLPVVQLLSEFGGLGSRLSIGLRGNLAEALLMLGRVDEATADEVLGAESPTSELGLRDVQLGEVMMLRGDLAAAVDFLADLTRRWPDIPDWTPALWSAQAEVHLWSGRPDDALSCARRGLATTLDNESRTTGWLLVQAARAAADLAILDPVGERSRRLVELDELRGSLVVDDPFDESPAPPASALRSTWQAECSRLEGTDEPSPWEAAASAWQALDARFRAGYCRWRQSEAVLARNAREPEAAVALRAAHELAAAHAPLRTAIEGTARRARIVLASDGPAPEPHPQRAGFGLTDRERAVLQLLGQGRTNAQIGSELFMSAKTASVHVTNILRKLGATSRTQAAAMAERAGLLG